MLPSFDGYIRDALLIEEDGVLKSVESRVELPRDCSAEIVDVSDCYVIPALFDFHMHLTNGWIANELEMYLRFGIAGVRDMGSTASDTVKVSDQIDNDKVLGPSVYSFGELVDGPNPRWPEISFVPRTPEDVASHVKRCRKLGLTGVKFYHKLSRNLLQHGLKECRAQGLLSAGHLGDEVKVSEAIEMGIDFIEHVGTLTADLVPQSALREEDGFWHYYSPFWAWSEHVQLDSPKIEALVRRFKATETVLVPTLAIYEAMAYANSPRITSNAYLALLEESVRRDWEEAMVRIGFESHHYDIAQEAFQKMKAFVKIFNDMGGEIGVGTDAPNPFIIPGASLHRELELLVEAGVPAEIALRQACLKPSKWLRASSDWGVLEPGKKADFLVLRRDPLCDISAISDFEVFVASGTVRK